MNKTTLFIAPHGTRNKKEALFKEIVSLYSPSSDYSSLIYLGPNRSVLSAAGSLFFSYFKKNLKKSAYIPFQLLTIKQFAANLHETYGEKTAISDRTRTLMLCEILKDKSIGYALLLSDLYRKIGNYLPDRELSELKDEISSLIFEDTAKNRAANAIEIIESYEDLLIMKKLIDPEGILKESIVLINNHINAGSVFNLVIDGFFDPTPLELKVIEAMIEKAGKVFILAEENTEILKYFKLREEKIETRKLKQASQRNNIGYYSYPSIEEEVEGIAKGTKKLIIEGMHPGDITVCFPSLSKYLPMLQRIFQKHGVPTSIAEYNLSSTPPFTVLEEMITCMEEDFPRSDFLSVLTSPHLPLIPEIVKERAIAYSYRAGIVKGIESWLSIKEILVNAPGSEKSADNREELNKFQKELNSIISAFEELKKKRDILSFVDVFESTLIKFGFFDSLETSASGKEASAKITGQFSELRQLGRIFEYGPNGHVKPGFYLRYMLQDLRGSAENREGVKVLPLEIAAGMETTALFFGGILEGDFPSRPDIDPILPEKVKKALGIPYLEYYLKRQKLYFKRLLNTSIQDPHFSCPSAEGDKIFLPSPFLDWDAAINPVIINLFSAEEVLIREGAINNEALKSTVSWNGEILNNRRDSGLLRKRIGVITRGHFSVTNIDYYRKCPLRFYIEKVLGLEMEIPPKYEVESRLWGSLAHNTMEYVFKDGDIDLESMEEKVFQGLEKSLRQFPIGDFWSRVAREIFRHMLPMIKNQENEIRLTGFSPFMVEQSVKTEINGLKLKGKIDRIDIKSDSGQQKAVTLLDYKTGTIDNDSLQLPLYAAMWQEFSSEPVEKVGYYSLKDGRVSWYPKKKKTMDEFIQNGLQQTEEIIKKIKGGEFPAEPVKESECRYCYHSPLCKK